MANRRSNLVNRKRKDPEKKITLLEPLESRYLLSASVSDPIVTPATLIAPSASPTTSIQGYTPAQIRTAYGITGDGAGQTIAIVDAYSDPNIAADLATFDAQFGLSAPPSFKQVSATGSTTSLPAANAAWDSEIALDVEWAHAIAPAANIVLVDAASATLSSLMSAVNYARNLAGVSVISMSWGTSEFFGEQNYDSFFTTPAGHTSITFVAASGDEGAGGGAEWPAVSPNVLSVGGTTLTLTSSGSIAGESAWSDSSGGASSIETLGVQSAATGLRMRNSPDVSYDANPATGFAVYDSVPYDGYYGWHEVGGTSAGAPQWAAIVAIADSARTAAKAGTLTTAQTLATIYSIYSNATSYASDFHDITSGSSLLNGGGFGFGGFGFGPWGFFQRQATYVNATTGYDILTGVGSPKGAAVISALASGAATSATTATTTTTATHTTTTNAKHNAVILSNAPLQSELAFRNLETNVAAQGAGEIPSPPAPLPTVTTVAPQANSIATRPSGAASSLTVSAASDGNGMSSGTYALSANLNGGAVIPAASDLPLGQGGDPAGAMQAVPYASALAQSMNLSAAVASSMTKMLPEVGQALRDALHDVQDGLAALSFSADDIKADAGGLVITVAIADALLLGYCYSNRNRKKVSEHDSLFNDGEMITTTGN